MFVLCIVRSSVPRREAARKQVLNKYLSNESVYRSKPGTTFLENTKPYLRKIFLSF